MAKHSLKDFEEQKLFSVRRIWLRSVRMLAAMIHSPRDISVETVKESAIQKDQTLVE
jgi:hypothetical protein